MLRGYIYDDLGYSPRSEIIKLDISKYLTENMQEYRLRFSCMHHSRNSDLTYADVIIRSVKICKGDEVLFTNDYDDLELTTRRDYDMLREKANPLITFTKTGDNSEISLGRLSKVDSEKVELEVEL